MAKDLPALSAHPTSHTAAMARGLVRARCVRVIDGDTADSVLDLGGYHDDHARRAPLAARRSRRALELVAIAASALLAGCYASHERGTDAGGEEGYCRVTCTADSDCSLGSVCNADGLCETGRCTSDADCPASQVCRAAGPTLTPECVPRCGRDGRCPIISGTSGSQRCEAGGCVLTGCTSDERCTRREREWLRNPTARARCEPSPDHVPSCRWICDVDADCVTDTYAAPLRCQSGYCVFEPCTSDAQCEAWWPGRRPQRCVRR